MICFLEDRIKIIWGTSLLIIGEIVNNYDYPHVGGWWDAKYDKQSLKRLKTKKSSKDQRRVEANAWVVYKEK
ncbi:hypothetical protein HPP92_002523 [Vanilla planifolia]|uniref:Uncharacterized protein n=1 Tax=Vanilla planifolia TaxID=51239 RepID=A0A835VMU8_VANPL|nr:hypothetical protein HPP92_002523 [Vanilla planifolia]